MIFVELFVPAGVLSPDQRRRIGERLLADVMPAEEGAPAEAVAAARAYTQVVVHEPDTWIVGGDSVGPVQEARYLVRVTLPAPWRKEMSPILIPAITSALAEVEDDVTRLYEHPAAWIQLIGVSEGSCGIFGEPMTSTDIVRAITRPYRDVAAARDVDSLPEGTALDPVCGMAVPVDDASAVVEYEGVTYAFCGNACHAVFEQDHKHANA